MTEKIKILHIIKSLGRGGAEMLLPETLKLHNLERFEFHYVYFLPWKNQMEQSILDSDAYVTCFPSKNNISLIQKSNDVIKYCKKNEIQLIHCHLPWAGFLGRLVHFKTAIPIVYTEHNMQERYHIVTRMLNKWTFNYQSLALGVSEDVTQSISKNINPKIPVRTLLNGVNTESFYPELDYSIKESYNLPKDSIVIGNIAVFRFQKRLEEWLQVFKKISIKHSNVYGIIVGAGPLEKEVKNKLNELDLKRRVFLPGLQTNVKPYLNSFDIFMMSSEFEGLPIALLEAMSMECAIVSTNAGGIKEVIRDKEDGLLCEVNNWRNLSSLASKLIENPEKLSLYKKRARSRVKDMFSLKSMVDNLENLYVKL